MFVLEFMYPVFLTISHSNYSQCYSISSVALTIISLHTRVSNMITTHTLYIHSLSALTFIHNVFTVSTLIAECCFTVCIIVHGVCSIMISVCVCVCICPHNVYTVSVYVVAKSMYKTHTQTDQWLSWGKD